MSPIQRVMISVLFVVLAGAAVVAFAPFSARGGSCGSPIMAVNKAVPATVSSGGVFLVGASERAAAQAQGCRDGGRDRLIWAGLIAAVGIVGCTAANVLFPSYLDEDDDVADTPVGVTNRAIREVAP